MVQLRFVAAWLVTFGGLMCFLAPWHMSLSSGWPSTWISFP
jgi:hypothetical protein